jgi:putative transposase
MSPSITPSLAELTATEREQAMARYQLIAPLLGQEKLSQADWQAVAEQAERSIKTIKRWVKRYQTSGLAGLARQQRSDKGIRRTVSVKMQRTIEALYLENRYRSMETVHTMTTAYARKQGEPIPSYTVVREICQTLPPSVVYMAHYGERAWRNKFEPISRHESHTPNERWQMDHCQLDLLVIDPQSGEVLGRPWLTLALDTYSRAVVGYHLSLDTPSSMAVCSALRQAIWPKPIVEWPMCGIPQQLHLDQGKDFTSRHLEQVAADLRIELIFATAYLARAKGKVERLFGTLNDQLWCELPGYVGPNVVDRPHKIEPSLTLSQVEQYLLAFLVLVYHQRPHSTTGQPPQVRWQVDQFEPRLPASLRELDILLMLSQTRFIQRDGVHLYSITYWADELADYIGQKILVRYDTRDISEIVVYHQNQFLCTATAPELTGLKISLKEWHALQGRQRKSVRTAVSAYRLWLEQERQHQLPLALTEEEVDAAILLDRLKQSNLPPGPALFPSDRPGQFLTSGQEKDYD